jgi:uncharacterized protein
VITGRRLLFYILGILTITSCNKSLVSEKSTSASPAKGEGSVWRVEGKNGGRLYLCGTIHLLRDDDYPLPLAYQKAYEESSRLLLELPPGSSAGGGMVAKMQGLGALPPGSSLRSIVGEKLAIEVSEWAKRRGQSSETLMGYHPWFVALLIAAVEYEALGAQPDKGVDSFFESRAQRDQKPGEGLESVDFQLGLFTSLSTDQQKDLLQQTLDEVKTMSTEFVKMIDAWREGDLETLSQMLFREADQYPELMEVFLHRRNHTWMPKLEQILQSTDVVMVLVGTGHFTGDEGLIALLKGRGYSIERVLGSN